MRRSRSMARAPWASTSGTTSMETSGGVAVNTASRSLFRDDGRAPGEAAEAAPPGASPPQEREARLPAESSALRWLSRTGVNGGMFFEQADQFGAAVSGVAQESPRGASARGGAGFE